jgi:quinolinate synthase
MPDAAAGCPMADTITAQDVCDLKTAHPGLPVVCYVNSSAEVKAESTVCCTSSNAVRIVESLPEAEVIFVPDQHLGGYVGRCTGKRMVLWEGACPIHAAVRVEDVRSMRRSFPDAEVMIHPECPEAVQAEADHLLSTGQMCDLVRRSPCREFIVVTESGIVHTLQRQAPQVTFHPLLPELLCPDMKLTTLSALLSCLETGAPRITVPREIAGRARTAVESMIRLTEAAEGRG